MLTSVYLRHVFLKYKHEYYDHWKMISYDPVIIWDGVVSVGILKIMLSQDNC